MPHENAEAVREAIEAWNRHELDSFLEMFDPECEVLFRPDVVERGPYHGKAELRGWAESFLAAFPDHRAEIVEMLEASESVVVVFRHGGRGGHSGAEVDMSDFHIFEFQGGKVGRWLGFSSRKEALEAAGVRE
jgi:ketosteroid isomerase-like protein